MANSTSTIDVKEASDLTRAGDILSAQTAKLYAILEFLDSYGGEDPLAMRTIHVGILPILNEVAGSLEDLAAGIDGEEPGRVADAGALENRETPPVVSQSTEDLDRALTGVQALFDLIGEANTDNIELGTLSNIAALGSDLVDRVHEFLVSPCIRQETR
jgi:hypothetical protein